MADESQIDPTNQKVGVLLSYGVPEEDIVARLSQSDDPEHQNWVRQYKAQQVGKELKAKAGLTESPEQNNEDAIKKQAELINQQGQVGISPGKLAEIGVVGKVGYELGKQIPAAVEYGSKLFGTLKDKMAVPPEVQAAGAEAPVAEAAPSGMDKLKQRLNPVPTIPAPVLSPEEVRQQRLKAAAAAAQGEMTPVIPGAVAPVAGNATTNVIPGTTAAAPAAPAAPAPTVVETITPPIQAAITNDPLATPEAKAEARVNAPETLEAPKGNRYDVTTPTNGVTTAPTETITPDETKPAPKAKIKGAAVPRAERGSLPGIAMNPAPVEGQPGMREQYNVPKTKGVVAINPATGEKFMGPGGFNYLTGQVGPERAAQAWEEQYGKRNVPAKQVIEDYASTRYPPTAVTAEGKSGGSFTQPKYIPEYIKGAATIGGMANAGLNALGVLGLISDFKEAKKTGDWSNFGLNATGQVLANVIPKTALPAQLATYSKALGESPEELRALGKKLQDAQQAYKFGAGRGMQGVPPPSAYNR